MGRSLLPIAAIVAATAAPYLVAAHQHCHFGARNPIVGFESEVGFCSTDDPDGFCCDTVEETEVQTRYNAAGSLTGDCADLHKEVVCSVCGPFSGHLYEKLTSKGLEGLTMKQDFCSTYFDACESQLGLESDYCDVHTLGGVDDYWSYPFTVVDFSSDGLTKAFPSLSESELPDFPMFMEMTPDGKYWWIAGIEGQIVQVSADNPSSVDEEVLQLQPISSFSQSGFVISKEEGLVGFALGPGFEGVGSPFYASYSYYDADLPGEEDEKARNRLSKFTYMGNADETLASEEILITTDPKMSTIHASGWVGFKPSAKTLNVDEDDLYWSVGDGGPPFDPNNFASNLDTLLGSIIRITVPRGSTANTESKYSIPDGNAQGEICSYGHRNPFRCSFDRETDVLYCGDVGQVKVEEVNIIECGQFYGWNRFEGDLCTSENEDNLGDCSGADFSSYTSPYFQYCHPSYHSNTDSDKYTNGVDVCGDRAVTGQAVIGGVVYRGSKYQDILQGKYVFQDFQTSVMHYVDENAEGGTMLNVPDGGANPPLVAFVEDLQGEVYVLAYDGDIYHLPCGDLCASTCLGDGAPPVYEAEGCFEDYTNNRVLTHQSEACPEGQEAMSPDICASYCYGVVGATHFGVQYSKECFCGTADVASLTSAEGECTLQCEGNPELTCGGYVRMELFSMSDTSGAVPEGSSYLGCYSDSTDRTMALTLTSDEMTPQLCSDTCKTTANNAYYGMQFGTQCYCGSATDDPTALGTTSCTMPCAGGGGNCGGRYANSLYQYTDPGVGGDLLPDEVVGAQHLGCFKDERNDRVMTQKEVSDNMSAEMCSISCAGSKFFGMQYGTECWCGDGDVERHGTGVCGTKCGGSDGVCGGYFTTTTFEHTDEVGLLPETVAGAEYLGCYKDEKSDRVMTLKDKNDQITAQACATLCTGSQFFGMQYGEECWCGDGEVDRHGGGVCDMKCAGGDGACGGYLTTTTYGFTDEVALEPETVSGAEYLGCYKDDKNDRVMTLKEKNDEMTSEACATLCVGSQFFGTQYGTECWCGDGKVDRHGAGDCDVKCAGGTGACGGYLTISSYGFTIVVDDLPPQQLSSAEYLGCYADDGSDRVMTFKEKRDDMTAEVCATQCAANKYFGLQYAEECWCGDAGNLDRHGEGVCDSKCTGGDNACGGSYALSVYESTVVEVAELDPELVTGATFLECYADDGADRLMTISEKRADMTASRCAGTCDGHKYFGLQYGEECWCGDDGDMSRHGAGLCDSVCTGNEYQCGGSLAVSVYEFDGSTPPTVSDEWSYEGCYNDEKKDRIFSFARDNGLSNLSPPVCFDFCDGLGASLFGLQYGVECWCGQDSDDFSKHTSGSDKPVCDAGCAGSDDTCGGYDAMDVYQITSPLAETAAYEELGCYNDSASKRILSLGRVHTEGNTIASCYEHCSNNSEAALFGLQYGAECWCGRANDNYDQHGTGTCNYECAGNPEETCGGHTVMTVYSMDE